MPRTTENTDRHAANLSDRTFGVEFEFVGTSRENVAAALNRAGIACEVQSYNHRTSNVWKVVTDSSVRGNGGGGELVSPILSGPEGLRDVARAVRAASSVGATVNVSCGFHVHVGCRDLANDAEFLPRLVENWCAAEDLGVRNVLAPSRRESGSGFYWARALSASEVSEASSSTLRSYYASDRYRALNLSSFRTHTTVEFRAHQGTLDAAKSVAWILFCLRIVDSSVENIFARSARRSSRGSDDGKLKNLLVRVGLRTYSRDGYAEVAPLLKWAGAYLIARRASFAGDRVPAVRGNLDALLDVACSARLAA